MALSPLLSKIGVTSTQVIQYHSNQITQTAQAGSKCSVQMLDKGMVHVLGRTDLDCGRFDHTPQKRTQFKTYGLLISGIFGLQVTETMESKTM